MDNRTIHRTIALVWLTAAFLATCEAARADFLFGNPRNLGPMVNSASDEVSSSISADGLSLYFTSNRPGGLGEYDLWVSTRPALDAPWEPAVNLGPTVNSPYSEMDPSISSDGLSLYFSDPHNQMGFGRRRPGGFAPGDGGNVWVTTRATIHDPWSAPVNLGLDFNSRSYDQVVHPSISADGLSLYVHICPWGIGVATRASLAGPFGTPILLQFSGNHNLDWWPGISPDQQALFVSVWDWGTMDFDLWMTTRRTTDTGFGAMTEPPPQINYPQSWTLCPSVSGDGSTLYFCSRQPGGRGGSDLWQAPILPVVDFNGDGRVDIDDLLRLIESWGRDDPAVDIGPMPWGDGRVDANDLEVLMGYWGPDVYGPSLLAHWKMDEVSGTMAADSAGSNDGTLLGAPAWQPTDGKSGGALLLDGNDDYITTGFVLDPFKGPLSVFAWIRGGASGQVMVSQQEGANWLMIDPAGALMTGLKPSRGSPLVSPAVVADGRWHRVGLTWDGSVRVLYVDDIEVARDAKSFGGLPASTGGLYLGAGSQLTAGTFWSGLIDDVRIYNRAVEPASK